MLLFLGTFHKVTKGVSPNFVELMLYRSESLTTAY